MKVGEIVKFPSGRDGYNMKRGLLLGIRDNPSDVEQLERKKQYNTHVPSYCENGPRQIADVLYKGKIMTCWKHNLETAVTK